MKSVFVIDGDPRGKARPRILKNGFSYTPKDTVQYENYIKLCYMSQCREAYFKKPANLKVYITVICSIPQSFSNKKKQKCIDGIIRPAKKPDCDNIAKSICDSLNKVAYDDDAQIVELTIDKLYGEKPHTTVRIETIDTNND